MDRYDMDRQYNNIVIYFLHSNRANWLELRKVRERKRMKELKKKESPLGWDEEAKYQTPLFVCPALQ